MKPKPCSVCGGTDLNLIDGYYYCVECGTQDVNLQETVVEQTMLADGTFAHTATRKFTTALKDAVTMSGEWHKWHTFNFILSGLVEEMITLGASSEFKTKVLWIWTRYMKRYVIKDDMVSSDVMENKENSVKKTKLFDFEDDSDKSSSNDNQEKNNKEESGHYLGSIKHVTKGLLIAIIYVALNFDRSDIQLSHLCRFITERRLSFHSYMKFIPKEMNLKSIPNWISFSNSKSNIHQIHIRQMCTLLVNTLDLGTPVVPDLRKIVDNIVSDLCLPNEFKDLVLSLMHKFPRDFLKYGKCKKLVRFPDYEGVTMSYVLTAFKMSFGLDDDYEIKLSDAVDKINMNENRLKSFKLGIFSDPTDRLFSFRDWCRFLQLRKTILCKYYLPMAQHYNFDVDDHVLMGQLEERPRRKADLGDEVTMDILNKIQVNNDVIFIPISEFAPSFTPVASYTEVILQYVQDPELKLLLSEDFTQYSLKYACVDLELIVDGKNIVKGISAGTKTVKEVGICKMNYKKIDFSMVYVRNCENKNWLKTKPPTKEHITKVDKNSISSDRDSNLEYDSSEDSTLIENDVTDTQIKDDDDYEIEKVLETIDEEDPNTCIFDDNFQDILEDNKSSHNFEIEADECVNESSYNADSGFTKATFDPSTFNKEKAIKELILSTCKKYKIPIPKEYCERQPRRRNVLINDETGVSKAKRRKIENKQKPEKGRETNTLISAYYANLQKDLLSEASGNVRSFVTDLLKDENEKFDDLGDLSGVNIMNSEITCDLDDNHIDSSNNDKTGSNCDEKENKTSTESLDSSVMDTSDTGNLIPKGDPRFDEKTYDTKQLYVKFCEEFNFGEFFEIDDPEINKILDKKIADCDINNSKESCKTLNQNGDSSSENKDKNMSDEESKTSKVKKNNEKLDSLVKKKKKKFNFKYWFRRYHHTISRQKYMKEKFNLELENHCSKSFEFIITECAALLGIVPFNLYNYMQDLEKLLDPE